MVRKKQSTLQNKKYIVLVAIALGLVVATGVVLYLRNNNADNSKQTSSHKAGTSRQVNTMETAFDQGQGAMAEVLNKYVQVDDSFFKATAKECYVSGEGYPGNTNQLDCSITNHSTEGGYVKADRLTNAQIASLMTEVASSLKSRGYKTTSYIQESIQQYAVLAERSPNCSLDFAYTKPMPNLPDSYAPLWVTTTSGLYYRLSCYVPVVTGQPGTFQISCSDTYRSQVPAGYTCK